MDIPDTKYIHLTDGQVKKKLLELFKIEIRDHYDVESYALTSDGRFLVKLQKRVSLMP